MGTADGLAPFSTTMQQRRQTRSVLSKGMVKLLCAILIAWTWMKVAFTLPTPVVEKESNQVAVAEKSPYYNNFTVFVESVFSALRTAPFMSGDRHALNIAFPRASMNGMWLEFGVFYGGTIRMMDQAYHGPGSVYGFDSFEGLPEQWRGGNVTKFDRAYTMKGAFDMKGKPPFPETDGIKWVVGVFDETLPSFLQNRTTERLSFIHIDCDLYSATKAVFRQLDPWLEPGVVIVFDELMHYPEYREHEIKALFELLQERPDLGFRIAGTSTRNVQMDVGQDIHPQAVAIQLCGNGNLDCTLTDGFELFEKYTSIQSN